MGGLKRDVPESGWLLWGGCGRIQPAELQLAASFADSEAEQGRRGQSQAESPPHRIVLWVCGILRNATFVPQARKGRTALIHQIHSLTHIPPQAIVPPSVPQCVREQPFMVRDATLVLFCRERRWYFFLPWHGWAVEEEATSTQADTSAAPRPSGRDLNSEQLSLHAL